jgi:small subunit ribosomal protein S1
MQRRGHHRRSRPRRASFVVVNAGLKSEAYVPIDEFKNDQASSKCSWRFRLGRDRRGRERLRRQFILSRDKAKRLASWLRSRTRRVGRVRDRHRQRQGQGWPHSPRQRHPRLPPAPAGHASGQGHEPFEGKTMEFKVIKLDRKRNNVVLSRRAVVEA